MMYHVTSSYILHQQVKRMYNQNVSVLKIYRNFFLSGAGYGNGFMIAYKNDSYDLQIFLYDLKHAYAIVCPAQGLTFLIWLW